MKPFTHRPGGFSAAMTIPEKRHEEKTPGEIAREGLPSVTIHGLHDAKCLMKAAEWRGKQNIKVVSFYNTPACTYLAACGRKTCWLGSSRL